MSITEGIIWDELAAVLPESAKDHQLINMGFWLSGWEEAFEKAGLSHAAVRLTQLLKAPEFDAFNNKMFYYGIGGSSVNIGLLASWLARRSAAVGAEQALQGVRRFLEKGHAPVVEVLVLAGISVEGSYDIGDGFKLMSLPELGKYDVLHFGEYLYSKQQAWGMVYPTAALVATGTTIEYSESSEQSKASRANHADQDLFWLVLCLLCSGGAPTPLGRWTLLPAWVPFSGYLDGGFTSALEIKHSKTDQSFGKEDVERAIELYSKLKLLTEQARAPIKIALYRLSQSMNTWDRVQEAIDLGVALESVLVGETTDQLSYQFRLMGALLTGDTLQERRRAWDVFKAVYVLRSKAVHNGVLPSSRFNVYGEQQRLTSREVMLEGGRLGRKAISTIIDKGGISNDEYTDFILSAGGRTAE